MNITKKLLREIQVLCAEPNIDSYEEIKIYDFLDVIKKSDLIFKLVDHKEFKFLISDQKKYMTLAIDDNEN